MRNFHKTEQVKKKRYLCSFWSVKTTFTELRHWCLGSRSLNWCNMVLRMLEWNRKTRHKYRFQS